MAPEFQPFPKIGRLFRDMVVTEKIDGTNACVVIPEGDDKAFAQSRKRLITPEQDNFGFAAWVEEHNDELVDGLGPGYHYGEWWGKGIQRGYGLDERRFSLFNAQRWMLGEESPPPCCCIVPVLLTCTFNQDRLDSVLAELRHYGSVAAPGGFKPAEGVVVYVNRTLFKVLIENDDVPKGLAA